MVECGMVNYGYEIIAKRENYVLAHNHKAVLPYVTWGYNYFRGNTPNFFWGHYFKECEEATRDFLTRK